MAGRKFSKQSHDVSTTRPTIFGCSVITHWVIAPPVSFLSADAFLDLCQEPEVRQIALIDAPSVVGWETWREVDARYGLGLLRMLLELAATRGLIDAEHVEHLSHLFLGAASEAAMVVAHHPHDDLVRIRMGRSLLWMIDRVMSPREN